MLSFYRGTTIQFTTVFYNYARQVVQPSGAQLNLSFLEGGQTVTRTIEMTAPTSPDVYWVAYLDTRQLAPGLVSWSIRTEAAGIPYGVEDGEFVLTANVANQVNF